MYEYIVAMREFWHFTEKPLLPHAHWSSRYAYWEPWVHPAPPVLSKKSSNALHPAAASVQPGLVVRLHWLGAVTAGADGEGRGTANFSRGCLYWRLTAPAR